MPSDDKKKHLQSANVYFKYSGMAVQMAIIIALAAYLGVWLDTWFQTGKVFVIIGSLSGVFLALYVFISGTNSK